VLEPRFVRSLSRLASSDDDVDSLTCAVAAPEGCVATRLCGKIRGSILTANPMARKKKTARKTLPADIGKVLKRLHYPLDGATRVAVSRASSGR
jgi:hypothetical protein